MRLSRTSRQSAGEPAPNARGDELPLGEPGLAAEVADEQIALVYKRGIWLYLAGVGNAMIYIAFVWERVPPLYALGWASAVTFTLAARWGIQRLYHRQHRDAAHAQRWRRLTLLTSGLNGVVWSLATIWLFPPHSLVSHLLLIILFAGVAAGATAVNASYLPGYVACMTPMTLSLAARLVAEGDRFHQLACIMFVAFSIAMGGIVRASQRMSREGAELRLQLRRASEHLRQLNQSLEARVHERTAELHEALEARDEFIQLASHELKTPLTPLTLQHSALELAVRRLGVRARVRLGARLRTEKRLIARLASLAQTLLDVSLLGAQKLELAPSRLDLAELVRQVVATVNETPYRDRPPVELRTDGPLFGSWDASRVEHIVSNLLSNALKYGAGEAVTVELTRTDVGARLTVIDHGIGMAPEEIARVFAKYARASSALQYGGLGLGLYLVKELVAAMGGRIDVQSKPSAGTRVEVYLPSAGEGAGMAVGDTAGETG